MASIEVPQPLAESQSTGDTAVLLLTTNNIDSILEQLSSLLNDVITREGESNRLIIWIESSDLDTERYQDWHEIHKLLTTIYIRSVQIQHQLGRPLFEVDVVLRRPGRSSWTESRGSLGFKVIKVYYKQDGICCSFFDRVRFIY
jgi:hypothetical protein